MLWSRSTYDALDVLMHLVGNPGRLVSIREVARDRALARNSLMKLAANLAKAGLIDAVRGRSSGLRLAHPPEEIRIGDIISLTERRFAPVDQESGQRHELQGALDEAAASCILVLNGRSLADVASPAPSR